MANRHGRRWGKGGTNSLTGGPQSKPETGRAQSVNDEPVTHSERFAAGNGFSAGPTMTSPWTEYREP